MSLGVSADFLPAVLDKAGLVIAEVNKRQPLPSDSMNWPAGRVDLAISCDRPVAGFAVREPDDTICRGWSAGSQADSRR